MERRELTVMAAIAALVVLAGGLHFAAATPLIVFAASAVALGGIAHLIGEATDHLGDHLGPAATGIVQSAVGNLPELFVCIFALRRGLVTLVQASLIGSILSNALLVLGLAFMAGGWRHKVLRFEGGPPRMIASLLMLAVAALVLPTLAHTLHLPASANEQALSVVCALDPPLRLRDPDPRAPRPGFARPAVRGARPRRRLAAAPRRDGTRRQRHRGRLRLGMVRRRARAGDRGRTASARPSPAS